MSVSRCKAETTSMQFQMWQVYLEEDRDIPTVDQWYLAQVAYEIRASQPSRRRKRYKLHDFLIKFKREVKQKIKSTNKTSKDFWFGLLGMKRPDKDGNGT